MKLKSIIRKPYYYVEPCPRCSSVITGRYMKRRRSVDNEWMFHEGLRKGELIEVVPEVCEANLFCAECGFEWPGNVRLKFFTLEQIEEEKNKRGTRSILNSEYQKMDQYNKEHKTGIVKRFFGQL